MQMPEIDGITLGEQIKKNPAISKLPLIMLTSTNQRDEIQRTLKIGFAAYLVKPVKPSRLLDTIMTILGEEDAGTRGHGDGEKEDAGTWGHGDAKSVIDRFSASPTLGVSVSSSPTHNFPKLRILLAEDNLVNQKVALKQLQSLGYSADVAANGKEVLELLEKIPYDLILMDCQMPILDGLETTKEIHRRLESYFASSSRPVVIAMTANAMKEDQQMCLDAGMDDYLSKPVMKEKLAAALERWASVILKAQEAIASEQTISTANVGSVDLPIDWEHLHQISENDPEFELNLLEIFVEDIQHHLEITKAAIAAYDFEQIAREAHQIKGASANVGAITMRLAAEKLEQLARNQERRGTTNLILELEEFVKRIQEFLIFKESNTEKSH
jgi:CheY-like chemotaxis protein/HPt (histidine-containing phosphotransfer) domain-containing protein